MDGRTKIVAGLLTESMDVTVAIGRLDYGGRFQPFGSRDVKAGVFKENGNVYAKYIGSIAYQWESPRIITHIAMLISDGWLVLPVRSINGGFHMSLGDEMSVTVIRNIGEYGLGPNP